MVGKDGFQPCEMDTGSAAPVPRWERRLVIAALAVHVVDVGLDVIIVYLFLRHMQWGFFFGGLGVILWAWLVSSLYVSFGGGGGDGGDIDAERGAFSGRLPRFCLNFAQVQIFVEAFSCIFKNGDTDFFYTLRLLEAILESTPSALVQLYALMVWAGTEGAPEGAAWLLRLSVLASTVSVSIGLAMWEQKVQFRISSSYIVGVAVMRAFEVASRSLTLAIFAGLTHPWGFWCVILADYAVMLLLIVRHQSVQLAYGIFVAIPLVLVSVEPLVWRWEDHAVPKDSYYCVRIVEFVLMWIWIIHKQETADEAAGDNGSAAWLDCEALALLSTLGLYVTLPCVWKVARKHELSRDINHWDDDQDEFRDGLNADNSDSDIDSGSEPERAGHLGADELPPE
jgi:hypothetical protein